ncbi:hypothetical protein, partial [Methanocalculus sp.]|uniref:hypothetical protein n=1 Tax=Methanocalculus sp. TaxID=2004547 RepID=UPI0026346B09
TKRIKKRFSFKLKIQLFFMTRPVFIIIIALVVSALFCGCTDTTAEPKPIITAGSAVVTDHIEELPPPGNDYVFVIVPVTIENPQDSAPVLLDDTHLRLSTKGAGGYDVILKADTGDWYKSYEGFFFDNEVSPIEYGLLQPGESISGDVLFIAFEDIAEPVGISIIDDDESTIGKGKISDFTTDITGSTRDNTPGYGSSSNAPTSAKPYVEVNSVNIAGKINGMVPYGKDQGYDEFLILDVTIVNPEGSGYEFPVNEETLLIKTAKGRSDYMYWMDPSERDYGLGNTLGGYIHEGETLSGELLYEVRDDLVYKSLWLCPDGNPDNTVLGVYELQNIEILDTLITAAYPYVEVQSVKIVDTISGITPAHQNLGYDKFLILDVTVVNPEGSGYEFPVNEETLQIITGDYLWDYCVPLDTLKTESVLENPLNDYIHEGETLSGELVYEVPDGMDYMYVRFYLDDVELGHFSLQNIVSQPGY